MATRPVWDFAQVPRSIVPIRRENGAEGGDDPVKSKGFGPATADDV